MHNTTMNKMQSAVRIEKVTVNFGAGKDQNKLEKGCSLLEQITGIKPVRTITQKRIPSWGLRPGLPVGAKVTMRGAEATTMVRRLLHAKDFKLKQSCVDDAGNVAFGVPEYIDIEAAKYDPAIGILGLEACVTLSKPGARVKHRAIRDTHLGKRQKVTKEEAMEFMKKTFKVSFGDAQ